MMTIGNLLLPGAFVAFVLLVARLPGGAIIEMFAILYSIASFMCIGVGSWMCTKEPHILTNEPTTSARLTARAFGVSLMVLCVLLAASYTLDYLWAGAVTSSLIHFYVWLAVIGLSIFTTALSIEWIAILGHASTKVLSRQVRRQPFSATIRAVLTIVAVILGPVGGALASFYATAVLYDLERLSSVRQSPQDAQSLQKHQI